MYSIKPLEFKWDSIILLYFFFIIVNILLSCFSITIIDNIYSWNLHLTHVTLNSACFSIVYGKTLVLSIRYCINTSRSLQLMYFYVFRSESVNWILKILAICWSVLCGCWRTWIKLFSDSGGQRCRSIVWTVF